MTNRDDFSKNIKLLLALRVGTICSNPSCSVPTYGPNGDPHKTTNIGVAAHITAAAKGGPRYDPNMSPATRKSIKNGIWLCQNCAKLIDSDENKYTVSVLEVWKEKAEKRAQQAQQNSRIINTGPNFASTIAIVLVQRESLSLKPPPNLSIPKGSVARRIITLKPTDVPYDLIDTQLPIQFGLPDRIPPKHCLISVICQNQGTGLDQNIKIDFEFESGAIVNYDLGKQERIQHLNGGNVGSWSASFAIMNLLPREYRNVTICARDEPFKVHVWSQNSSNQVDACYFDVILGGFEVVPIEKSPYGT